MRGGFKNSLVQRRNEKWTWKKLKTFHKEWLIKEHMDFQGHISKPWGQLKVKNL